MAHRDPRIFGHRIEPKLVAADFAIRSTRAVTNSTFPPGTVVSPETVAKIARRWLRAVHGPDAANSDVPLVKKRGALTSVFSWSEAVERTAQIQNLWREIEEKMSIHICAEPADKETLRTELRKLRMVFMWR